eukprot:m.52793 g.52793  ORF g.52793 m.52793 type:complete len:374 (+) comp10818_c0_seq1:52-1173(+)
MFKAATNGEAPVAIITGAGSGMGREMAYQLAEKKFSLALCDLNIDTVNETRDACKRINSTATMTAFKVDVKNEENIQKWQKFVQKHHGDKVSILINNAGIAITGSFLTMPKEKWDLCFDILFHGSIHCTRSFLPMMTETNAGSVVFISSICGFYASLGPVDRENTPYAAAKFAVKGFAEALRVDMRQHYPHIKVHSVHPGHIGTPLVKNSAKVLGGAVVSDDKLQSLKQELRRVMFLRKYILSKEKADQLPDMSKEEIDNLDSGQPEKFIDLQAKVFEVLGSTSASEAAKIIIDGIESGNERILVGEDAKLLDVIVRCFPVSCYNSSVFTTWVLAAVLGGITRLGPYRLAMVVSATGLFAAYKLGTSALGYLF